MKHHVTTLVIATFVAVTAIGCKSAEEKCNASRVAAYDKMAELETALAPACGAYQTPSWLSTRQRAHESLNGMMVGRSNSELVGILLTVSPMYEGVERACAFTGRAKQAARGGAIPFRDASKAALDAIKVVQGLMPRLREQKTAPPDANSTTRITAEAATQVLAVLEAPAFATAVREAQAAASASWTDCSAVSP